LRILPGSSPFVTFRTATGTTSHADRRGTEKDVSPDPQRPALPDLSHPRYRTYGDTTYEFTQDTIVTPTFRHSATKSCGFVSTYVGVDAIPAGAIAKPEYYDFKVTITNRRTDETVMPDHGRLRPGQSSSFARSFGEDSGPRDVRIFKNGVQVRIIRVATDCR
jgi:hypothetical protein